MHPAVRTTAELEQLFRSVHADVTLHFALKYDHLRQGLCAGLGFKSHAALVAALKTSELVDVSGFNHLALIERLQAIGNSHETAEAVSSIIDGRRLSITIKKQPQNPRHSNTSYYLEVIPQDVSAGVVTSPFFFIMPLFGNPDEEPPYQVDSAAFYRHSSEFSATRPRGRGLLTVEGTDGKWFGGLFIYDPNQQLEDTNCKRTVSAALARKILPAISPRFNCQLYKPDGYQKEAWKLRVSLGNYAREKLGSSSPVLEIPSQKARRFSPDEGYRFSADKMQFKDGLLEAHIYSNGISEDENPTSIDAVRAEVVRSIHLALAALGVNIPPYWNA
ncbi:hypothetical protein ACKJSM_28275 [Pseudomonas sp. PHC1]|uniref:hypothetical protein n=1 Tax=Pseudomonas sp. PHC1 TaxID=3384759 RepID=UPI00396F43B1